MLGRWAAILLIGAVFAFLLYWVATMAFKPGPEWNPASGKIYWFPSNPTLANFEITLGLKTAEPSGFLQQPTRSAIGPLKNSLIAAGGGTLLAQRLRRRRQ